MSLLDALHSLAWPARRRSAGRWSGLHPSGLRGRSPELTEYRGYRPGDDSRDIDWKLLARSDRPFVRLSEDRATHATWFLLDASASMAFPAPSNDKWRTACAVVQGLAFLAQRAGDPVGVIVAGAPVRELPATTRRDVMMQLDALLSGCVPRASAPLAPLASRIPVRVRLAIVSDLLGDADALREEVMSRGAAGGEVNVVQVLSHEEWFPAERGTVVDPEDATCERSLSGASVAAYREALSSWVDAEAGAWHALGAACHLVSTQEDVVAAIRRIVVGDPVVARG